MLKKRTPSDFTDYLAILKRRAWWIAIPLVIVPLAVFIASFYVPKMYRSQTMILVEPQVIPSDYIHPTVSSDITQRLQTLIQEILSRTRLEKIIDQFGLYRNSPGKTQEDLIEMMRKDITVDTITDESLHEGYKTAIGAFKISYVGSDPAVVQNVTRQLAALFIEENLKVREQQAEGTSEFISGQLDKAKTELDDQEKRLADFKVHHTGSLPEQEAGNLQMLGQLQTMLQANSDVLARDEQQKIYLQAVLTTAEKPGPTPISIKSQLELRLDAARVELRTAEERYTPTHPDVIALKRDVAALEKTLQQQKTSETATPLPGGNDPSQIKAQLSALDKDAHDRTQRQAELEQRIRDLQGRVEHTPVVEQQYSKLDRDYQVAKQNYDTLLQKKNSSAMAAEMERNAKGEQFQIIDPANFPEKPFKPDLLQLNLMGLLAGLGVGAGLAFLLEMFDKRMYLEKDITHYLGVPVFGTFPLITTVEETVRARKKRKWIVAAVSVSLPLLAIALYGLRNVIANQLRGIL